MHRYIAIEGPIGVGKTALATRLASRLEATTVLEETENPFLADFYAGRAGAALQAQLFYLLNRHRQQMSLRQGNLFAQATVSDYLFDRDKVFAYLNLGQTHESQIRLTQEKFVELTSILPPEQTVPPESKPEEKPQAPQP